MPPSLKAARTEVSYVDDWKLGKFQGQKMRPIFAHNVHSEATGMNCILACECVSLPIILPCSHILYIKRLDVFPPKRFVPVPVFNSTYRFFYVHMYSIRVVPHEQHRGTCGAISVLMELC